MISKGATDWNCGLVGACRGGQDYEVRYEAKKKHRSKAAVKKAFRKVGSSRKRVEHALSRKKK